MREILFRGKDDLRENWIYGSLISHKNFLPKMVDSNIDYVTSSNLYDVLPDTVSQQSGLYDINNNPIYEGDIVKVNLAEITSYDFICLGKVKFGIFEQDGSDGEFSGVKCLGFYIDMVVAKSNKETYNTTTKKLPWFIQEISLAEANKYCEVVGNVYDNPDFDTLAQKVITEQKYVEFDE